MIITAKIFATLRLKVGRGEVSITADEPITVRELLRRVGQELGRDITRYLIDENESIIPGTMILVGGKNIIHLNGLDTPVDTSEVAIFPPAGGG